MFVSIPSITPDDKITGRKNIALTKALPLNFWLSISATKKLNIIIARELKNILEISSDKNLTNSGSTLNALI